MKKGFSLVELILVMTIIAVGLVTMLLVLHSASMNNANAHYMTVAGKLAEAGLEEIMADRRTRGFDYIVNTNYPDEDPVAGFGNYIRTVNIYFVELSDLNIEAGGVTDYKRVDVIVESLVDVDSGGGGGSTRSDFAGILLYTVVSNY